MVTAQAATANTPEHKFVNFIGYCKEDTSTVGLKLSLQLFVI